MKESAVNFIEKAYRILDSVTPLEIDCGKLCDGLCCKGGDHDGMWLLPHEDELLKSADFLSVKETTDGKVAMCSGKCERALRPFSCRIYPYFPLVVNHCGIERIKVVPDIRALSTCYLFKTDSPAVTVKFKNTVARSGRILLRHPETRKWLIDSSDFMMNLIELRNKLN